MMEHIYFGTENSNNNFLTINDELNLSYLNETMTCSQLRYLAVIVSSKI